MEKRYVVPDGMLVAAAHMYHEQAQDGVDEGAMRDSLEAAIRWLAENPVTPKTYAELPTIGYLSDSSSWGTRGTPEYEQKRQENYLDGMSRLLAKWQRRMFLAPQPEVPEAIKDLMFYPEATQDPRPDHAFRSREYGTVTQGLILEAYRRGLEANRQGVKDRYDK